MCWFSYNAYIVTYVLQILCSIGKLIFTSQVSATSLFFSVYINTVQGNNVTEERKNGMIQQSRVSLKFSHVIAEFPTVT